MGGGGSGVGRDDGEDGDACNLASVTPAAVGAEAAAAVGAIAGGRRGGGGARGLTLNPYDTMENRSVTYWQDVPGSPSALVRQVRRYG